jgi:long-chain acyl-CoA synthetase
MFDENPKETDKAGAESAGLKVYSYLDIMQSGKSQPDLIGGSKTIKPHERDDVFQLCYTSGTTGDPKGVKSTHWGIISACLIASKVFHFSDNDILISYLPSPHVFD